MTDRRCPYCNGATKPKAFRCPACASLIIGKKRQTIPAIVSEEPVAATVRESSLQVTPAGLFFFGLMVFIPGAGQLAGLVAGIVCLFYKDPGKRRLGRVLLGNAVLFFVFWAALLYFANETFGLVDWGALYGR